MTEEHLEKLLKDTHTMATSPAKETICQGSGWEALERKRRAAAGEEELCSYLDFGKTGITQDDWCSLLENGCLPKHSANEIPKSWMLQPEWTNMLESAVKEKDRDNSFAFLELGTTYIAMKEYEKAKTALDRSVELEKSALGYYGLAILALLRGENENAGKLALLAIGMNRKDASLAKEVLRILNEVGYYRETVETYEKLPSEIAAIGRVRHCLAFAELKLGNTDKADEILNENGEIVVSDMRESEVSLSELWFLIEEEKAKHDGRQFDRKTADVPDNFDFRMNIAKKNADFS